MEVQVEHQEKLLEKVKKVLKKKKKDWYFLGSPRKNEEGVWRFWLNPSQQHIYEAGWFTLEELKQWANDEGPVIKKK